MLEMLVTGLVAAFIAVVVIGHVMLFKALRAPDRAT
jgi:hypothetical protein